VNVSASVRVSMKPVPGAERDAHPYGHFALGSGTLRLFTGTNPAANVDPTITVPSGLRWRVFSAHAQLVADANAATRVIELLVTRGSTALQHSDSTATQVANTTRDYSARAGLIGARYAVDDTIITIGMGAPLELIDGDIIEFDTANRQAGDNWGAMSALVEEWVLAQEAAS